MTFLSSIAFVAFATNICGTVTFVREDIPFYFVKDTSGLTWRVERPQDGTAAKPGDRISVSGTVDPSIKPRIVDAAIAIDGAGAPPESRVTEIAEIFEQIMPYGISDWYGETFTVEGILRDVNRRQTTTQLLVGEDDKNIQVEVPYLIEESLPPKLVLGARLRVTGALAYTSIENIAEGVYGRIENVELIPMYKSDVKVVKHAPKPPFWNGRRLAGAFGTAAGIIAILLIWLATLKSMVRKKTGELAESIRERETTRIEADASRRERLRLAADLHDGFQQYLAGAMFRLKAAANYLPKDAAKSREQLEMVRQALQHTQNGLRSTLWAMNEESEGPESLTGLLKFVARRMAHWEKIVEIESSGEERNVARNFCGTLLLIVQEAVGNAIKHGQAGKVKIKVRFDGDAISLCVEDDGIGFDGAEKAGHYGLKTMERRITDLGGEMHIESSLGKGTKVFFEIPDCRTGKK